MKPTRPGVLSGRARPAGVAPPMQIRLVGDVTGSLEQVAENEYHLVSRVEQRAHRHIPTDRVQGLDTSLTAINTAIDALPSTVDVDAAVAAARAALEQADQNLNTAIGGLDTRLAATEQGFSDQGTRITNVETEQGNQASRLTAVESQSSDSQSRVAVLETTTSDQGQRLSLVETESGDSQNRVSTLETTTADQASRIGVVETKSANNENSITTLTQTTDSQAQQITSLTASTVVSDRDPSGFLTFDDPSRWSDFISTTTGDVDAYSAIPDSEIATLNGTKRWRSSARNYGGPRTASRCKGGESIRAELSYQPISGVSGGTRTDVRAYTWDESGVFIQQLNIASETVTSGGERVVSGVVDLPTNARFFRVYAFRNVVSGQTTLVDFISLSWGDAGDTAALEARTEILEDKQVLIGDDIAEARSSIALNATLLESALNPNATFGDYPTGANTPGGWTLGAGSIVRVAGRHSPNAVRLTSAANQETHLYREVAADPGWVKVRVDVTLKTGDLAGSGALLYARNSGSTTRVYLIPFGTTPDINGVVHGETSTATRNKVLSYDVVVDFTNEVMTHYRIAVFGHLGSLGSIAGANSIDIHRAGVYEPTSLEIDGGKALAATGATFTQTAQAVATLDENSVRYAVQGTNTVSGFDVIGLVGNDGSDVILRADRVSLLSGEALFQLLSYAAILNRPIVIYSDDGEEMTVFGSSFGSNSNLTIWGGKTRGNLNNCLPSNGGVAFTTEGRFWVGGVAFGADARSGTASGGTSATVDLQNANGTDADVTASADYGTYQSIIQADDIPPPSWYSAALGTSTATSEIRIDGVRQGSAVTKSFTHTRGFEQLQEPFTDPEVGPQPGQRRYWRDERVAAADFAIVDYNTAIGQDYTFSVHITSSSGASSSSPSTEIQYFERGA